jgi:hypothetical protein
LPPRGGNTFQEVRPQRPQPALNEQLFQIQTTTTTPAPTTFNQFRPQPSRFTNYNTLPPEFDIAPFTTPDVPFFEFEHSNAFQTTTPTPTTTTTTTRAPPTQRRVGRPRRPIPQPLPSPIATTTQRPQRRPVPTEVTNPPSTQFDGPAVFSENDGKLGCSKRGVYAHPTNCGMFVVCAPASRSSKGLRSLTHHCPADQVFVQEVGRCRPGNKDKCEVF